VARLLNKPLILTLLGLVFAVACKKPMTALSGVQALELGNYYRKELIFQKPQPPVSFVWESGQIVYLKKESKTVRELMFSGRFSLSLDESVQNNRREQQNNRVDVDCSLKGDKVRIGLTSFNQMPVTFAHIVGPCARVGSLDYTLKYLSFEKPSVDGFSLLGQLTILEAVYSFEERYAKGYP
jgi:hypothetical protein